MLRYPLLGLALIGLSACGNIAQSDVALIEPNPSRLKPGLWALTEADCTPPPPSQPRSRWAPCVHALDVSTAHADLRYSDWPMLTYALVETSPTILELKIPASGDDAVKYIYFALWNRTDSVTDETGFDVQQLTCDFDDAEQGCGVRSVADLRALLAPDAVAYDGLTATWIGVR